MQKHSADSQTQPTVALGLNCWHGLEFESLHLHQTDTCTVLYISPVSAMPLSKGGVGHMHMQATACKMSMTVSGETRHEPSKNLPDELKRYMSILHCCDVHLKHIQDSRKPSTSVLMLLFARDLQDSSACLTSKTDTGY